MTRPLWGVRIWRVALIGSGSLLVAALLAEHVWGLRPCPLCQWQRAGHLIALISIFGLRHPGPRWAFPGLVGTGLSALVGSYHLGSERGWWSVPSGCSGAPDLAGLSPEGALALMMASDPVRCDEVLWSLLGLSMAGWNAVLSAALLTLWVLPLAWGRLSRSDH
jgi:disulfide bond formation protein DsbB